MQFSLKWNHYFMFMFNPQKSNIYMDRTFKKINIYIMLFQ